MLLLFCIVCLSADQTKKEVNVLHISQWPEFVAASLRFCTGNASLHLRLLPFFHRSAGHRILHDWQP
jgi:hypothetical protein